MGQTTTSHTNRNDLRRFVLLSILIALQTIFSNTLGIRTPILRVTFGFFPLILSGIILGPVYAAIGAVYSDLIGFIIFQTGATFFPGYTFTALLSGLVYGFFLYNKPKKLWRIISSVSIVKIILHLGLNTYWTYIAFSTTGFWLLLSQRSMAAFLQIPIQVAFIWFLAYRISDSPPALPFKKDI